MDKLLKKDAFNMFVTQRLYLSRKPLNSMYNQEQQSIQIAVECIIVFIDTNVFTVHKKHFVDPTTDVIDSEKPRLVGRKTQTYICTASFSGRLSAV